MALLEMSHVSLHYHQFDRAKVKEGRKHWFLQLSMHTGGCVHHCVIALPTAGALWEGSSHGRIGCGIDR